MVAVVVIGQLVMKAPVWAILIARVSDLVGGGGWHRAFIIDVCIKNFGTWWLIGLHPHENLGAELSCAGD